MSNKGSVISFYGSKELKLTRIPTLLPKLEKLFWGMRKIPPVRWQISATDNGLPKCLKAFSELVTKIFHQVAKRRQ